MQEHKTLQAERILCERAAYRARIWEMGGDDQSCDGVFCSSDGGKLRIVGEAAKPCDSDSPLGGVELSQILRQVRRILEHHPIGDVPDREKQPAGRTSCRTKER